MNKQSALEQIQQAAFEDEMSKLSAIPFPWVKNNPKKEIEHHQKRIEKIQADMDYPEGSLFRKMQERKVRASEKMIEKWQKKLNK